MIFGDRRLGKFSITLRLLVDMSDKLKNVLGEVVILEASNHFHNQTVEYLGMSHHFRPIEEGEEIPEYLPIYTSEGKVVFEEVNRK